MPNKDQLGDLIHRLEQKFTASGQDINAYLEGLLHADYLNYWDYVQVDTLLTLQKPRTNIPDEMIFIVYHQITELYFKLCMHEVHQVCDHALPDVNTFTRSLKRMNAYFKNLTASFDIMVDGMDHEQFLQFRMSLLPASGFQSAQYRRIEICATPMINLVDKSRRDTVTSADSIAAQYDAIYWKEGATELATGKKTLTLTQFESRYSNEFIALAEAYKEKNIWNRYLRLSETERNNADLIAELKAFDTHVNVKWPLVHYKSAVRYLQKSPADIAATGGTNWQKYLPPRFQKRIFFPDLWTAEEIDEWGKAGIVG